MSEFNVGGLSGRLAFVAFLAIAVCAIAMLLGSGDAEAATDTVTLYRDAGHTVEGVYFKNDSTIFIMAQDGTSTGGTAVANITDVANLEIIQVTLADPESDGSYSGVFVIWDDDGTDGTYTNDAADIIDLSNNAEINVTVDIDSLGDPGSDTARADFTPPATSMYAHGTFWWDGPLLVAKENGHSIELYAMEGLSGLDFIEYSLDGGAWTNYTSELVVPGVGFHLLEFRSTDIAGNVDSIKFIDIYVAPYWTGNVNGNYIGGYAFGCNITVAPSTSLVLYNFTLIMNSTTGNTQYIHAFGGSILYLGDWDSDPMTDDGSLITNIATDHYYYLNVYGGELHIVNSGIAYCGFVNTTGPEPASFEDTGAYVVNGFANIRCADIYSPYGVGLAFEGPGDYSMDNFLTPTRGIHDCVIGFAFKDTNNARIFNTVVEDCYLLGGYANNVAGFGVGWVNFTGNGEAIALPDGFGGGLYVEGSSPVVISYATFWENDGIGLAVSGVGAEVSDCIFYNNNQMSPNPMAEAVIMSEGDAPETIHATITHNVVNNSMDDHGFLLIGPVGISAWSNMMSTAGGYGICSIYETEATHPYVLPDFTIYNNEFYGYGGIEIISQKNNSTNETTISVGQVYVNNNQFDVTYSACYVDQYFEGATTGDIGYFEFTDNDVGSDGSGLYVNERAFYECAIGADIEWGITEVSGNNIMFSGGYGICFNDDYVYYADFAIINVNDVYINDNNIEGANGEGIYFYGEMCYLNSTYVCLGHIEVARNNITMTSGYGIDLDYWDSDHLYGTTYIWMPGAWIHGNNVSGSRYNIWVYWDYAGMNAYDFSTVRAGDLIVEDNILGNVASNGYSLYVDQCQVGYYMYDNAVVAFGDVNIRNNELQDTTFGDGSYGIYYYLYYAGYEMRGNSSLNMGSLYIYDNDVVADDDSLYVDIEYLGYEMYDSSRAVYGDIIVYDNELYTTSDYALDLYLDYLGSEMYHTSYFEMGDYIATGNNCSSSDQTNYVYVSDFAYDMFDDSRAIIGDIILEDNNFTARAGINYAVYIYYDYLGYEMYGRSSAISGDFRYNGNMIDAWMTGIYASSAGDFGAYMYDGACFEYGNFETNNNTIVAARNPACTDEYGFYLSMDYVGYEMYGRSFATMGHLQINDNNITVLYGADSDGLYISYIDDFGSYMYNEASFVMTGDFEINRNYVNNTLGYYGIRYDIYNLGNYMYGNNYAEFQNFYCSDNIVIADDRGIYSIYDYFGYEMYGTSTAAFGDIEVNRNNVSGNLNVYGIYADWYDFCNYMYADNLVTLGHFQMNENVVKGTGLGDGIHLVLDYWAYYNYGLSECYFGDVEVNGNDVTTGGDGFYFDWYDIVSTTYSYSWASLGDFYVLDNHVVSDGYGMYWSDFFYDTGYYMYDDSYGEIGSFYCMRNNISASDTCIYLSSYEYCAYELDNNAEFYLGDVFFTKNILVTDNNYGFYAYWYENGYYLYGNARAFIGGFYVNDNFINSSSDDGVYIDLYEVGCYLYDSSEYHLGDLEVCNNTIASADDGIYLEVEYFGYYNEDSSVMIAGAFRINDNVIDTEYWSGGDGIEINEFDSIAYSIDDSSQFEMGNIEACRNVIDVNGDGIYWYEYYYVAYDFDYGGSAVFGDVLVNGNDITADSYGIYIDDWYYVGYYLYEDSWAQFGNFEFNGNSINCSSDGIYFDEIYEWGYELDDDSRVTVGNFEICRNFINSSSDDGIYFSNFYEFGAYLYDNAVFEMGDWLINDNTIIAGSGYGIYFYSYEFGYENVGSSVAIFSDHEVMRNNITSTSDGIQDWWLYDSGYYLYDDAYAQFGDARFMYNTINTSAGQGLYLGPYGFGYYIYDSADVIAGDYCVTFNDVISDSYGVYIYIFDIGIYLDTFTYSYSSSTVILGDVHVDNNTIESDTVYGVYVYYYYLGYEVYDISSVNIGKVWVNDNTIAGIGGIYIYCNEIGYDLYGTSRTEIGGIEVARNTIASDTASEYGIYLYEDWLADTVSDSSYLWIGATDVHDNVILTSYGGIGFEYRYIPYVYNFASVRIEGTYIHDCTVNATEFGLELTLTDLDGSISPDAFLFNGPVEVRDCSFTSGGGILLNGDAIEPSMDYLIHDLDFTDNGDLAGYYAIESYNMPEFLVERCTFDGYENGIYTNDGNLIVAACSFLGITGEDVDVLNDGHIFIVECPTVNVTNMFFSDALSTVDIGWYHDVSVMTWVGGYGVPYADVQVISNNTVYVEDAITGLNGHVMMLIRDKRYDSTSPRPWPVLPVPVADFNPHNFTATKNGESGYAAGVSVTGTSQSTVIYLNDTLYPVIGASDLSDPLATTGDPFTFRIGATDDLGIRLMMVYYRFGTSGAYSSATMTLSDSYSYLRTMSSGYVGTLQYYFRATDVSNKFVESPVYSRAITDNDSPLLTSDATPAVAFAGRAFTFRAFALDNVGITGAFAVYRYGTGPVSNLTLSGTPLSGTITPIWNPGNALTYKLAFRDAAGNWLVEPVRTLIVARETSTASATTGDDYSFVLEVNDPSVASARVEYWYGDGTHSVVGMTGTPYSFAMTILDTVENLTYRYQLQTPTGLVMTADIVKPVTDNDLPTIISDLTTSAAFTGAQFDFSFDASDNIAVSEVTVAYWFDADPKNITLFNVSGPYLVSIILPINSTGLLHYYYMVNDTAGNSLLTVQADLPIVDNIAPVLSFDGSNGVATTGDPFHFQASVLDNIGVARVFFLCWLGVGGEVNFSASGMGPYTADLQVPPGFTGLLHYRVLARDANGNWLVGSITDVAVSDDDAPAIASDESDKAVSGGIFNFRFEASDNIALTAFHVVYWIDGGARTNLTLGAPSPYEQSIAIAETSGDLHYYAAATDGAGNWAVTPVVTVSIDDKAPPVLILDDSDNTALTGEQFAFRAEITDDTLLSAVFVVHRFGTGSWVNLSMSLMVLWEAETAVPGDSLDSLEYYFAAVDSSGNWLVTPRVTVGVVDIIPPYLAGDESNAMAFTGTDFSFSADVRDNIGVADVHLVYWLPGETETNVTLTTPYGFTLAIPSDAGSPLSYRFSFTDAAGNWYTTEVFTVPVMVSLTPADITDKSSTIAYTGDAYLFALSTAPPLSATDVFVMYWFGTGAKTNATMDLSGDWEYEVTVPLSSTAGLHYYFGVHKGDGSWGYSQQVDVAVYDNDAPQLVSDDSDTSATAGESFTFTASASDNIGVLGMFAVYSFDGGSEMNATMVLSVGYTATITVPSGAGEISYRLATVDAAGNWHVSDAVRVPVGSSALSGDIIDLSDDAPTTGDSFEFRAFIVPGSPLSSVSVVYWFGSDAPSTVAMSGSDPAEYEISIPAGSIDQLHYRFNATDGLGLWAVTPIVHLTVEDNDAPMLTADSSFDEIESGHNYTISITAWDNIAMARVVATVSFADATETIELVFGNGSYLGTLPVLMASGAFNYSLLIEDAAGNSITTAPRQVVILDMEPATLGADGSDSSGKVGEAITFSVEVSDEVGISEVYAVVWYNDNTDLIYVTLSLEGNAYVAEFVPAEDGTMHYYFLAIDESGNEARGNETTVAIDPATTGATGGGESIPWWVWLVVTLLLLAILAIIILVILLAIAYMGGRGKGGQDDDEAELILEDSVEDAGVAEGASPPTEQPAPADGDAPASDTSSPETPEAKKE